jgi:predicted ribosome quality control (RQC) complex YloA/Tae2 family protein
VHPQLIQLVVEELQTNLTGRYLGKIFQLSHHSFAFDFGLRGQFLFVSVAPASPRLYLIQRRTRDLEKQSVQLGSFGQLLKAKLSSRAVKKIQKDPADRIVRFHFDEYVLVAQLTGRAADLILSNETETKLRGTLPIGQIPPEKDFPQVTGSPSEYADAYFSSLDEARQFNARANNIRSQFTRSLRQKQKLKANLAQDLTGHGDPEAHKRIGDLLLANIATAKRTGNRVTIVDYFADNSPSLEIEVDENTSLQDEAAQRFRQYTKAKHAREEIASRIVEIDREIAQLTGRLAEVDRIIHDRDEAGLGSFTEAKPPPKKASAKQPEKISGVRRYLSSDGYEILVGRAAKDNDHLTFKVAQPNDLWLHAGDYPGSHVVVRNPTRKEIPHRTVIEAAQLAGRFSQASEDTKVVIHYTPRKFLSKPKGAASGLVRLSRFRSLTVEPKESVSRIID